MNKNLKLAITLSLIIIICGSIIAQQPDKNKKDSTKSKNKKETVLKKRVQIPDSLKKEMELKQGLLLRETK